MKVAVCICTATGAAVNDADLLERRGRVGRAVLSPYDARAVEQGLRTVEAQGGEVVALALTSASELAVVREALALGANRAVILDDPALSGSDLVGISHALAALIRIEAPDLVLACFWPGDVDGTLLLGATAERLGLPMIAQAQSLSIEGGVIMARRQVEVGDVVLSASLPCLVEVAESINKPRYPTVKAKLAARTKPVRICTLADVGLSGDRVGPQAARARLGRLTPPPPGRTPRLLTGAEATAEAVVTFLAEREFVS